VLASVRRPNCPYTFRVILGFCGCNLKPSCFRIRRAASTAARASAADLQLVTRSSAKLVSWYPLSRISLSNGVSRMLLACAKPSPPCGVPRSLEESCPLRWLPALSLARRSTRFGSGLVVARKRISPPQQPAGRVGSGSSHLCPAGALRGSAARCILPAHRYTGSDISASSGRRSSEAPSRSGPGNHRSDAETPGRPSRENDTWKDRTCQIFMIERTTWDRRDADSPDGSFSAF